MIAAYVLSRLVIVLVLLFRHGLAGLLRRGLRLLGAKVHVFVYRNPYTRRCIHCNLHQDEVATWMYGNSPLDSRNPSSWETMCSRRNEDACW